MNNSTVSNAPARPGIAEPTAYDVFPWRSPATGRGDFGIGGVSFDPLETRVFIGSQEVLGLDITDLSCAHNRALLVDGPQFKDLHGRGQQVYLKDLPIPVWVSWFYQKRPNGMFRKRFLLSTRPLTGSHMARLGAKRWRIEGFFKTMKQNFGVASFAVRRLKAVLRVCIFFPWLAHVLSYWVALARGIIYLPDWRMLARQVAETFFASLLLWWHEREAQRLRAQQRSWSGFDLSFLGSS